VALYVCSPCMLSWRGQGKLNIFSLSFPRGVTSAVIEARLHILAHSPLMQFVFHASSPKTVIGLCPPDSGTQFSITLQLLPLIQSTACSGITNISPACNTYLCFIESDCCKRIGKVWSRKLLFSLICKC
jgi:hypothetical protein